MKMFAVLFSSLHMLAISSALPAALVQAETVDPVVQTVPNPFQGDQSNEPAAAAKRTVATVKTPKTAKAVEPAQSDAEAKTRCGADVVVWANKKSKVYHYASSSHYGRTKNGVYMCEKESVGS